MPPEEVLIAELKKLLDDPERFTKLFVGAAKDYVQLQQRLGPAIVKILLEEMPEVKAAKDKMDIEAYAKAVKKSMTPEIVQSIRMSLILGIVLASRAYEGRGGVEVLFGTGRVGHC